MNTSAKLILLGLIGTGSCLAQERPPAAPAGGGGGSARAPEVAAPGPPLALMIEAAQTAIATCKAMKANVAVSVIDSAGVLKLMLAADGAFARAISSSTMKAVTAKDFNMPISELAEKIKTDPALAEKVRSNRDKYVAGAGGLPLRVGNELIGAVGVGGAIGEGRDPNYPDPKAPSRDEICAKAAIDKIGSRLVEIGK